VWTAFLLFRTLAFTSLPTVVNITSVASRFWVQIEADFDRIGSNIQYSGGWEYTLYRVPNTTRQSFVVMDDVCRSMKILVVNPESFVPRPVNKVTLEASDPDGMTIYQSDYSSNETYSSSAKARGVLVDFPEVSRAKAIALFCTNMTATDYMFIYRVIPFNYTGSRVVAKMALELKKDLWLDLTPIEVTLPPRATFELTLDGYRTNSYFQLSGLLSKDIQVTFNTTDKELTSLFWTNSSKSPALRSSFIAINFTNPLATPQKISLVLQANLSDNDFRSDSDYLSYIIWMLILIMVWVAIFIGLGILCCVGKSIQKRSDKISYVLFDPNNPQSFVAED
jgi:hypothetical protein